ncbi:MAG: NAD-dependent epimerase/dehydratase family protein [Cyanobacteria bacterium J06638_7]
MRITILGCGYVGSALARHWQRRGDHHLRVTTTTPARRQELAALAEAVQVLEGSDAEGLAAALAGRQVAVFSLAPTGKRQVGADGYASTYLRTFEALEQVLPRLPELRQLIYTGSCSVYGDAEGGWVDETTPPRPHDRHGEILLASEQRLLACAGAGRRVTILRLGAIYGPGREIGPRLRPLAGSTRAGDGSSYGNWIHRDDVVGALDWALVEGVEGIVNLVDDEPLRMRDLFARVLAAEGLAPVCWDPAVRPAGAAAPPNRRIANRRLHELGYRLRHPALKLA